MKNYNSVFVDKFAVFIISFFLTISGFHLTVSAQALDPNFQGNTQGTAFVYATLVQPDGKILVAGRFNFINNSNKKSIVRLNADGSLDNSFDSGVGVTTSTINGSTIGTIYSVARQTDGKILIGGSFNDYNGTARNRIARLNADGSIDTTFNPGTGASSIVRSIVIQPDGKILVGGDFSSFSGNSRGRIVRLNADGSPDSTFNPSGAGADSSVLSIGLQTDGKIVIGGSFSNYNSTARPRLARLNGDGTLDVNFNAVTFGGTAPVVQTVAIQTDGNILIGGSFTTVNTNARNNVARLTTLGFLDSNFNPGTGTNGTVNALVIQTDGKVLIGGAFGSYNGTNQNGLARVNADGSADGTFNTGTGFFPSPSALALTTVYNLTLQTDGKILTGGNFRGFNGVGRNGIVRLNANGSLDTSFNVNAFLFEGVQAMTLQSDGRIIIGGGFAGYNGVVRNGIARVNVDGSLDASFDPGLGLDNTVNVIAVQPDGKILIGGFFTIVNGVARNYIARLNSNGLLDTSFNVGSGANATIRAIVVQTDGKILIGGDFTSYNGTTRKYVARLNTDGSLDTSFAPPVETVSGGSVQSIVIQPDNKILIAGYFMATGAFFTTPIVRLNANGSLDNTFAFSADATVVAGLIALQADGKVVMTTGSPIVRLNPDGTNDATFNTPTLNGNPFALVIEPGGSILIGGAFTTVNGITKNHIARLLSNGSLDVNSFSSGTLANSFVQAIAVQSGAIYVAGYFTAYNDIPRNGIARLNTGSTFTGRTSFDFDGDGRADVSLFRPSDGTWYLLQSTAGFAAVRFGLSNDKLAPADFDGDGKADVAVFRSGVWYILQSTNSQFRAISFGTANDLPRPGDFDGDGRADVAVFRPSSGTWFYLRSSDGGFRAAQFGTAGDIPIIADFDGDSRSDFAVFRPSSGTWYYVRSTDNQFVAAQFGLGTDIPIAGDFNGDARTDLAVFRPSNGTWYVARTTGIPAQSFDSVRFGASGDVPVAADYDGDGKTDIAVYRGSSGSWYVLRSASGAFSAVNFGISSDAPIPASYLSPN